MVKKIKILVVLIVASVSFVQASPQKEHLASYAQALKQEAQKLLEKGSGTLEEHDKLPLIKANSGMLTYMLKNMPDQQTAAAGMGLAQEVEDFDKYQGDVRKKRVFLENIVHAVDQFLELIEADLTLDKEYRPPTPKEERRRKRAERLAKKNREKEAATEIQRIYRGYRVRKELGAPEPSGISDTSSLVPEHAAVLAVVSVAAALSGAFALRYSPAVRSRALKLRDRARRWLRRLHGKRPVN